MRLARLAAGGVEGCDEGTLSVFCHLFVLTVKTVVRYRGQILTVVNLGHFEGFWGENWWIVDWALEERNGEIVKVVKSFVGGSGAHSQKLSCGPELSAQLFR